MNSSLVWRDDVKRDGIIKTSGGGCMIESGSELIEFFGVIVTYDMGQLDLCDDTSRSL